MRDQTFRFILHPKRRCNHLHRPSESIHHLLVLEPIHQYASYVNVRLDLIHLIASCRIQFFTFIIPLYVENETKKKTEDKFLTIKGFPNVLLSKAEIKRNPFINEIE